MVRAQSQMAIGDVDAFNQVGKSPGDDSSRSNIMLEKRPDSHESMAQNQAAQIECWLQQYGFAYNPFQFANSERDLHLTRHFVEDPDFEKTLGLADQLLFARTGDGKTTTRLWLQSYYRDAVRDHKVFAFSYLIPQEIAIDPPALLDRHLEEILTAAVRHAFIFLALRGVDLPNLQDEQTGPVLARQFAAYFDRYYGLLDGWQEDLQQALVDYSLRQAIRNLKPVYDDLESLLVYDDHKAQETTGGLNLPWVKRWLQQLTSISTERQHVIARQPRQRWQDFCSLLQVTGLERILILVDGVDVKPGNSSANVQPIGPAIEQFTGKAEVSLRMESIIRPVLAAMQEQTLGNQVIWKLFLPLELYLPLSPLLSKSENHAILRWDHERLHQLLKFRLEAASNGAISTLLQLAEADVPVDLETFLIVQSSSSPRYLIHYINKILGIHVDQTDKDKLPGKLSGRLLSQIRYLPHRLT